MIEGPRYSGLMPPEYRADMAAARNSPDIRYQDRANLFEQKVRTTFQDLERTVKHVRLPTTKGTRYHTGLSPEVLEQTELPGLANIHTANHERMMKVLTQENIQNNI